MKSHATRLDEATSEQLVKAAERTGLRVSDLLRVGATMVIARIKEENGLLLGGMTPRPKRKVRVSSAA